MLKLSTLAEEKVMKKDLEEKLRVASEKLAALGRFL